MTPVLSYCGGPYPIYFYITAPIPKIIEEVHMTFAGDFACEGVPCDTCPCSTDGTVCNSDDVLGIITRLIPSAISKFPEYFL